MTSYFDSQHGGVSAARPKVVAALPTCPQVRGQHEPDEKIAGDSSLGLGLRCRNAMGMPRRFAIWLLAGRRRWSGGDAGSPLRRLERRTEHSARRLERPVE